MAGTNIEGHLKDLGLNAAEKVKEIVQFEVANSVKQIIEHAEQHPIGATVHTPDLLSLAATVSGGAPIKADIGLTSAPITLDLGRLRMQPDFTIRFKLFGIPIWSIDIKGTTDLGPQP